MAFRKWGEGRRVAGVASATVIGEANAGDNPADGWFPESVAVDYDAPGGANAPDVVTPAVDVLEDLADGPVLEFAVGTGRIAAPLAARGVPVSGIELSRAMASRIAGKPGGDAVEVTIGDVTTTRVAGQFSLVYLVFNTISNVTTQDGQVDVFRNAAAHLRPGGLFLVEVGLPDLRRLPPGQDTVPSRWRPASTAAGMSGSTSTTSSRRSSRRTTSPCHRTGQGGSAASLPVCLAGRDGPHGAHRRDEPEVPLGRLGPLGAHG